MVVVVVLLVLIVTTVTKSPISYKTVTHRVLYQMLYIRVSCLSIKFYWDMMMPTHLFISYIFF